MLPHDVEAAPGVDIVVLVAGPGDGRAPVRVVGDATAMFGLLDLVPGCLEPSSFLLQILIQSKPHGRVYHVSQGWPTWNSIVPTILTISSLP